MSWSLISSLILDRSELTGNTRVRSTRLVELNICQRTTLCNTGVPPVDSHVMGDLLIPLIDVRSLGEYCRSLSKLRVG
jgi:hypothetical protein